MYKEYWGLADNPFTSVLDGKWYIETPGHDEALARLLYVVEQARSCGVLVGSGGSGKSLLLRVLMKEVRRLTCEVALIDLLGRTSRELLWEAVAGLGLGPQYQDPPRVLWRKLHDHIATNRPAGMATVLIFDNVDRAEPECTSAIERLTQLGTNPETGLTVVLAARTERLATLNHTLPQLADLQMQVPALDRSETVRYIEQRLVRAGASRPLFVEAALERVFTEARGVPRDVNRICELALVTGMADGSKAIAESHVIEAVEQWRPAPRPLSAMLRRRMPACADL